MALRRIRKLTDQQVCAIRGSTEDAKILAARYGVQRSCIYRLRNKTRKQLVPELMPDRPKPTTELGSPMKPVTIIANLRKDMKRIEQQLGEGAITLEFAEHELSWMRQVIEQARHAVAHAAAHPLPSAVASYEGPMFRETAAPHRQQPVGGEKLSDGQCSAIFRIKGRFKKR